MEIKSLIALFSIIVVANSQDIDWCAMQKCAVNSHIACNNDGAFASTCISPVAVSLTEAQKQQILDAHNSKRNNVSLGQVSPFLPAKRMAKLKWNDQMASLAELNTKQCKMAHDKCHNTPTFKYSGQNLAMVGTTGTYTTEVVIDRSVKMWFDENSNANMSDINKCSSVSSSGKVIGHFTALVTDRSTAVGCAISSYKSISGRNTFNIYLLACNYASTNMMGLPVYKTGPPASACTLGSDDTFPGLCNINEPIDANILK